MDASTSAGKLITALKQLLKAKGLHYRDVASQLKVSEGTIKRYLNGKGVSIDVLEQLAEVVQLDLLSLAVLTQQQHTTEGGLTRAQQAALIKNEYLLTVHHWLGLGFTPAQLIKEFDLAEQMDSVLANLDALGLIRRLNANSVKVLVKLKFGGELEGHVKDHKIASARRFLTEIDLYGDRAEWLYYSARLSPASVVRLRVLMNRFVSDVEAMTKSEISLPPHEVQWYRLFVGTEPTSRKRLFRQK